LERTLHAQRRKQQMKAVATLAAGAVIGAMLYRSGVRFSGRNRSARQHSVR
jgi:hypothetical protein